MVSGCNVVLAHRLSATGFDKKGWTVYIKDFMKVIFVTTTTTFLIQDVSFFLHNYVLESFEEARRN